MKTLKKVIDKKVVGTKKEKNSKPADKKVGTKKVVKPESFIKYLLAIEKKGAFNAFLIPFDDERTLNNIRNTGKVIGEVSITTETNDDKTNSVLVILK